MVRRFGSILFLLFLMINNCGCSNGLPKDGAYKDFNVIIVLIDALRYDHLGCYGYKRDTSPNIDALSKQSIVFKNAIAQATWTKPSIVSLFTSNYVTDHGIRATLFEGPNGRRHLLREPVPGNILSPNIPTLAKALKSHGYKTKAFIANGIIGKGFGLEQGFDEYEVCGSADKTSQVEESMHWVNASVVPQPLVGVPPLRSGVANGLFLKCKERPRSEYVCRTLGEQDESRSRRIKEAEQTTQAIDWINARKDSKFFIYLHYNSTHLPYDAPPEEKKRFKAEYKGNFDFRRKFNKAYFKGITPSQEDKDELVARYDGAVRYTDSEFGRLMKFLLEKGLLQKTIILVTADHGESLWENGLVGHGYSFNTVIQVPLIFFPAQKFQRKDVDSVAGLIDVAPSVLGLLGVEVPPSFKGGDLFHPRKERGKEFEFAENLDPKKQLMVRSKDYIFKYNDDGKEIHLYHLRSDPYESKDVNETQVELVEKFRAACELFQNKHTPLPVGVYAEEKDFIRQLKALGYVQ